MKDGRLKKTDDSGGFGGFGDEIVREILVCPSCAEKPSDIVAEGCGPPVLALAA
jgi:hypothetical protein